MALLFFDGFEGIDAGDVELRYGVPISGGGTAAIAASGAGSNPPSPNGRYLQQSTFSGLAVRKNLSSPISEIVIGTRIRFLATSFAPSGPANEFGFWELRDFDGGADSIQLTFSLTPDLALRVRRGSLTGTILGTTTSGIVANPKAWNFVEAKVVIDNSGSVEIRLNGITVLTLTGVDTQQTANNTVDAFRLIAGASSHVTGFDDLYLLDTSGSAPYNDFLGNVYSLEMLPSAAGDSTQWTPNAGANWDRVDDATEDGDTTYVSDSTAGDTDLYNLTNPSSSATIIRAVKVITTARKADAGAQNLELLVKSGTTTDASAPKAITDSYAEYNETWLQNPDTSADWTIADLNALQSGFRIPT
jgi:hypothetical protein